MHKKSDNKTSADTNGEPNYIYKGKLFLSYSAFELQDFGLFLFHIMLFLGFGFVFFKSVTSKL